MRLVVLFKAYVRSHSRTLPSGRTVTIPAYFTKRVPKGEAATPGRQRALKQAPPPGVHRGLTPEQLAHRLVRHVQEGTLTHEEAEANVAHLERRAHAGHGLEHGHGPAWTAEHVHQFVGHARGGLQAHREAQARQKHEENIRQIAGDTPQAKPAQQQKMPRYVPVHSGGAGNRPWHILDTTTGETVRHPEHGHVLRFDDEAATAWAERENQRHERQQEQRQEPHPSAQLVEAGVDRYRREGERGLSWWYHQMLTSKDRENITAWLVATKHPSASEPGSQENRLTGVVREMARQRQQAQPPQGDKPRPAQGITQQERQQAWDQRMRMRQQAEREKPQGQTAPQPPRRARGQRHRAQVQAVLARRQAVGKSLLALVVRKSA